VLKEFRAGRLKYLVNVNVLTTGFDAPNIDCVPLLRPTMSPGLYYQMVGRGFRLCDGKENCLVLDFGGNVLRHGPVDAIRIREPGSNGNGQSPAKECPQCRSVIAVGYSVCPDCGYEFPKREQVSHDASASTAVVLSGEVTVETYPVQEVVYGVHVKRNAPRDAPRSMRVEYRIGFNRWQSERICLEHTGYARHKAELWWRRRSNVPVPETAEDAVYYAESGALAETKSITVRSVAGEQFDRIVGQQGMDIAIRGKKPIHGAKYAQTKKLRPKDRPLVNDFVSDEEFARLLRLWFGNIQRVLEPGRSFDEEFARLLRAWFGNIQRVLEPGRSFYIWGGYSNIWNYPNALRESQLYFSQMIIWVKEHPVLTRKDFLGNHEWCTLIAAEKTGRRAFLMEIDPLYCDVIVKRWEEFTGRKAERTSAATETTPASAGTVVEEE